MKKLIKIIGVSLILSLLIGIMPASAIIVNRDTNRITDGNMESASTTWGTGVSTVTKVAASMPNIDGVQAMRMTYSSGAVAYRYQNVLTGGRTYRFRACGKGDSATTFPYVETSNNANNDYDLLWNATGNVSTWGCFDLIQTINANANALMLYCQNANSAGEYCEWDNISVTPYNGTINNREKNLLLDSDNEKATVEYSVGNSATLSKVAGTADGTGSQVLRVAYNGVTTPYATKTVLTSGSWYRITGYAKGSGSASAGVSIYPAVYAFLSTTSATFQKFDVVAQSSGTAINLICGGATSGYCEFENVVITPYYGAINNRSVNMVADGNMEASTTGAWGIYNATLSKQNGSGDLTGSSVIRVAYLSTGFGAAYQQPLTVGRVYRVRGQFRGNGTSTPAIWTDSTPLLVGTNSTIWQQFDITFIPSVGMGLYLYCSNLSAGNYVEFDNITITRVY